MEGLGRGACNFNGPWILVIQQPVLVKPHLVIANGKEIETDLPCTIEQFIVRQRLLPRSVIVEHNGEAVAPSEFANRQLKAGDRLEIVKIVAGG